MELLLRRWHRFCFFGILPTKRGEIATAILIPLVIFNCTPLAVMAVSAAASHLFSRTPQEPLPFKPQIMETKAIPLKYRLITYALIAIILSFVAGSAIWLGSFAYASLYIPWAILPARRISHLIIGISVLPMVALFSFYLGVYCHGKFRSLPWISLKITNLRDLLVPLELFDL